MARLCFGTSTLGIANYVITLMKKIDVRDAYIAGRMDGMKQDQSIDLNCPVGFYIEPKVVGVFYPYFVRNRDVPIFAKDNAIISPVFKHPYSHEDLQGYLADLRAENVKLACLLSIIGNPKKPMNGDEVIEAFDATECDQLWSFTEGVRWAEKYHGIGGEDE